MSAAVSSYFCGAIRQNIANAIAGGRLILDVKLKPLNSTEKHFTSECELLTVYLSSTENDVQPLELEYFVKKMPSNNSRSCRIIKKYNLFGKEAGFFTILLENIDQFCHVRFCKAGINVFEKTADWFPKVAYASEVCLYSENLRLSRYIPSRCLEGHDFQHAEIVLRNWAKFQARTFQMIKDTGHTEFIEKYDFLQEVHFIPNHDSESREVKQDSLVGFIDPVVNSVLKLLKEDEDRGHQYFQRLSVYENASISNICQVLDEPSKFLVVNHGDLWNNNMFFSYGDQGQPQDVKFFDLQITRVNSPAVDISYYFNSLEPSMRKQNWKKLLTLYYEEFKMEIIRLGFNLDLSFQEFLEDFRRKAVVGFLFGLCGIVFWSPILSEAAKDADKKSCPKLFTDIALIAAEWVNKHEKQASDILIDKVVDYIEEFDEMRVEF